MPDAQQVKSKIERLSGLSAEELGGQDAPTVFLQFRNLLDSGEIRAAEPAGDGAWRVNAWVKQGILLGFRIGEMADQSLGQWPFFDKDTWPIKRLALGDQVRIVPGGSTIRSGSYVAPGVVCMPPMYINVGAYVDEGTMVDSHALVGSCAQIGRRVHLSAGAQIGGVLEPVNASPVIVEDEVFIGANSGIFEGWLIRKRAVLSAGVNLTRSTRLYDLVNERVISAGPEGEPPEVPEGAVIVPGSRPVLSDFGRQHGLSLYAPVIVKYRDEKTDVSTVLEEALR